MNVKEDEDFVVSSPLRRYEQIGFKLCKQHQREWKAGL